MGAAMAQLSIGWQLAAVLAAALLVLAILEGLHLLFFPRRVWKRLSVRYPPLNLAADSEAEVTPPRSQPAPKPQTLQASGAPRRWQRPERHRPKAFAPRMRRPMN